MVKLFSQTKSITFISAVLSIYTLLESYAISVAREDNRLTVSRKYLVKLGNSKGTVGHKADELLSVGAEKRGVDLRSTGVHYGAYKTLVSNEIFGYCFKSGNAYAGLISSECQAFDRCRANADSRK